MLEMILVMVIIFIHTNARHTHFTFSIGSLCIIKLTHAVTRPSDVIMMEFMVIFLSTIPSSLQYLLTIAFIVSGRRVVTRAPQVCSRRADWVYGIINLTIVSMWLAAASAGG